MKKFTGNFLLGEHRIGNVLRKIGLSMVVILMAVTVFAQAQETLHVWAEDVSDCYRYDNDYGVQVSFRDFVKIDTFVLVMNYDETVLSYTGFSNLNDTLNATSTFNITETSAGTLQITWDSNNDPLANGTLVGNQVKPVFVLHFELDAFPETYLYDGSGNVINDLSLTENLTWSSIKYWNDFESDVTPILTTVMFDGSITVTQTIPDVVVDAGSADCNGLDAIATVTTPASNGYTYSFNGNTFTSDESTTVSAPSTENTVRVMDGACVSFYKEFDVTSPEVLGYTVDSPVYTPCPGGLGDIQIAATGGTPSYTYYVIPIADTAQVKSDLDQAIDAAGGLQVVAPYGHANNIIQRNPGEYWVAVQDANNCHDMRDLSWWTVVEVIDNKTPWAVNVNITDLKCHVSDIVTAADGSVGIGITGATPFVDGYNVWFNDTYQGRMDTLLVENLIPGNYSILVSDSLGCDWEGTATVTQPDPISFQVIHTDASCNSNVGSLTIDTLSVTGGTGDLHDYWWVYSTSPDFSENNDTVWTQSHPALPSGNTDMGLWTTADSLAPGVYYIRVFDAEGCFDDYVNVNDDNAIKVLTTEFDIVYDDILCEGETTDVSIVLTTGAGDHTFEYRMIEGTDTSAWQASNTFADVAAGTYTFEVHDTTIDCILSWTKTVIEPTTLNVGIVDALTLPPTCPGNSDGNLVVAATGGTPFTSGSVEYYEYKMDDGDWIQATEYNTFAVDTAGHTVYVRDANGCSTQLYFNVHDDVNTIDFNNVIYLDCNQDVVNLFAPADADDVPSTVLDGGHFIGWSWYGDEDAVDVGIVTFSYDLQTPDTTLVDTFQGLQQNRMPVFYISSTETDAAAIVAEGNQILHSSEYGAGTYYVVAVDEWGCLSNVEEIEIVEPDALSITVDKVAAGCDGSTDGKIMINAMNGQFHMPDLPNNGRYEYVLTQQVQIFDMTNWYDTQVSWVAFQNGTFANDSLAVINVQEGTYWVAVRDSCARKNPDLIVIEKVEVGGADPVVVDMDAVDISNVTCNVYGEDPSDDGSITGLLAATTGGFGGYTFDLTGPVDESNQTGDFSNLPAGNYTLTVSDDSLGCQAVYNIDITQPDALELQIVKVYPSCFDTNDGILRYVIMGGTAPYEETTNNVGMWEDPMDIPAERWFNTTSELDTVHEGIYAMDRRVRAGDYEIYLRDANGCIYGPVEVNVLEPAQLQITNITTEAVSCNNQPELNAGSTDDGSVEFDILGGWDMYLDGFDYHVTVKNASGTQVWSGTYDELANNIVVNGLSAGDYTIELYEHNNGIENGSYWVNPIISYYDYKEKFHEWEIFAPYQNGDATCIATADFTIEEPDPITYDVAWNDVMCHNTHTGSIELTNIAGGTPDVDNGYYVGLEGPIDYDATKQSNYGDAYYDTNNSIVWFFTEGNSFTFDNLIWGHYTVHIQDGKGCWIYEESGEIEDVDTLEIQVVQLVENAKCYDGQGTIQIDAIGGVPPYKYAVDSTLIPNPGFHTFPDDIDLTAYLDGLGWQDSDTFKVTSATWIGYVMDANGCVVGFSTDVNGNPLLHHRVTVLQPDPVEAGEFDQDAASCFGAEDGDITIENIWGGNGGSWTVEVTGTDYKGDPVSKVYTDVDSDGAVLDGLPASTNLTDPDDMTADDYYTIVVYDSEQCASAAYTQFVLQPEDFVIQLKDKHDAFICHNDLAGIFEIQIVSGGTPWPNGLYKYKWEAYADSAYTTKIDSLSDGIWGFTETFLGYAGIHYRVFAQDYNGCEAQRDTFINQPEEIKFSVQELTCFGDSLASARVAATGTPGRSFRVLYKEKENYIAPSSWTTGEWFTESIDLMNVFTFDNENLIDVHYAILIEDTLGCRSAVDTITFDKVQHPLVLDASIVEVKECTSDVELTVNGGIPPYVVTVNGEEVTEMTMTLDAGMYDIMVTDAHLRCTDEVSLEIAPMPVVRDTSVETYIGEKVQFTDAEAGLDTMLAEGSYVFEYTFGADSCVRTLNVEVVGVPRPLTIAEVQGEGDASPWVDAVVKITGTVTAVAPGEGFFVQDANAAWSGVWVEYSDASTEGIQIGNGVEVEGTVAEVASVTTVIASSVSIVAPDLTVVPVDVASPSAAEAEMYESVLVKVAGARSTAADAGSGEWTIYFETVDDVVVNDWLFAYTPTEGNYYNVTGVVNARLDAFKVEPRMAADIEDLATTPAVTIESVQFKVYPNPFNDRIYIDNNDKLTRVVVSNIAGQRVIDVEFPSREIRTANLVSGVYVVSMFTEDGIAKTERIVKR